MLDFQRTCMKVSTCKFNKMFAMFAPREKASLLLRQLETTRLCPDEVTCGAFMSSCAPWLLDEFGWPPGGSAGFVDGI